MTLAVHGGNLPYAGGLVAHQQAVVDFAQDQRRPIVGLGKKSSEMRYPAG